MESSNAEKARDVILQSDRLMNSRCHMQEYPMFCFNILVLKRVCWGSSFSIFSLESEEGRQCT